MTSHLNRLSKEKSPYLLQHAHNPVDWFPWGEDAFNEARRLDKPIFLSIGYSTCHWCHVMERESFEHEEVAALMNDAFVCIKVDREERPDIDNIYMTVCQMMTGQGGWPLTIIMTPDRQPFHAATYIPSDSRFGRMGMRQLIPRLVEIWRTRRDEVLASTREITSALTLQYGRSTGERLNAKVLERGFSELMEQYDRAQGGFGLAPKFPTPHRLVYLLRYGNSEGIRAVEHTLEAMRKGGIYDHIGFGFHRYSTDNDWLVPHFEKMLYDQALLVQAYTEAYELTRKPLYRRVAEEILCYVLRDMTSPEGGFFSAEDADSEGEEGRFYTWDAGDLKALLGDDFSFVAGWWNIASAGNYRDESTGLLSGRNIPHLSTWPEGRDERRLEQLRNRLFTAREQRIHPLKDTKILADWNGLMIAAMARAARVFGNTRYRDAAAKAAGFVQKHMSRGNGELWHRYCDGDVAVPGQMEDYAFQIQGLLELYDLTLEAAYLEQALQYNDLLGNAFADPDGGYFMTADSAEQVLIRPRNIYDGAVPSGNAVQMSNQLRMARLTSRFELEQQAADTGRAFGGFMHRSPSAFTQTLTAFLYGASKGVEIVVVGEGVQPETDEIIKYINSVYDPGRVLLFRDCRDDRIPRMAPFTRSLEMLEGRTTVYICRNFACEKPITSLPELQERYPGVSE